MDQTVFVVDDDDAVRKSLTFLLRTEGIRARAFPSAIAFLEELRPEHNGCVVTDVRMPEMDGIALVQRLKAMDCKLPIIVITGHADVPLAVQAMKAGVADFIEKPFETDTILRAVRMCLETSRDSYVVESHRARIEHRLASLTDRERQVFEAVTEGQSNKQMAMTFNISPRTVEIYRANVMAKMQADSLSDLVKMRLAVQSAA